jgi:hypothetical protein
MAEKPNDYVSEGGIIYTPETMVCRLRLAWHLGDEEEAVDLSQHAADVIEEMAESAKAALAAPVDLVGALRAILARATAKFEFPDEPVIPDLEGRP